MQMIITMIRTTREFLESSHNFGNSIRSFFNHLYFFFQLFLILGILLNRPGSNELFDLARPELNWVQLANGMGVEAVRVQTLEGFADAFAAACARPGPFLIEFQI